ncbi:helix-turn-helix domain-containing protein [Candidatus Poriferisodalis sp.]|uniref:helix-turn-helix domain-containing protein n=1 Tax=Candidatus Poriferisodalis sp. TaxID=3101277 RepID=UPI003B01CF6D
MALDTAELGQRIAAARRDAGLTQAECATRAGLHRSALAKIETGGRGVGAMELANIAEAVDIRIEWLFNEAPAAVISRRRGRVSDAPSPSVDRMVERATRETEFLQRLGVGLELPPSPAFDYPATDEETETAAAAARRLLGYGDEEPANYLARAAEGMGLLTFSLALGDESADGTSMLLTEGGVAVINGNRAVGRRRLTLAHEIGHYVFADEYSTDWIVANSQAEGVEARIDRFARALLLPRAALRERWHGGDDTRTDAVLIASEFRVDMSTLAQRLAELDVAPAAEVHRVRQTRTRQADIVDHGLIVPVELEPPTLPEAYSKAVLRAYRGEEISAARALGLLFDTWDEEELPELPKLPHDDSPVSASV